MSLWFIDLVEDFFLPNPEKHDRKSYTLRLLIVLGIGGVVAYLTR